MARPGLSCFFFRDGSIRSTACRAINHLTCAHMIVRLQGEDIEVVAEEGKTLLEVAHENDIELEGATVDT